MNDDFYKKVTVNYITKDIFMKLETLNKEHIRNVEGYEWIQQCFQTNSKIK